MKKKIVSLAAIVIVVTGLVACKGKKKEADTTAGTEQTAGSDTKPAATTPATAASSAKTYQMSFSPDTLYLGKEKEAFVKLLGGEAIELQDAEGKITGMNIKFNLRVTNKSTLDDKKFFNISYNDARLELDNGTNTTTSTGGALNPVAESSMDAVWEFEIPAGTKPTKLNLFYDGTRVPVTITLK